MFFRAKVRFLRKDLRVVKDSEAAQYVGKNFGMRGASRCRVHQQEGKYVPQSRTKSPRIFLTPFHAPRSADEIDRWVAKTDAIEIISHFTEYHAMVGGIYKSKS